LQVEVEEEIHDATKHTCIIHARSTAGTPIGPYGNEYALILTFTDDGRKVTKFDEFVDSAYSQQFVAALAKAEPAQ
jgi:ketosteroid isomerase-like protein